MIYSDAPAQEDELGRDPFAKQIAENMVSSFPNGMESIVLGLNGRWGSGKSTMMKFIVKHLKTQMVDNPVIIYDEFNPWMFSGQPELQQKFLEELKPKLKDPTWWEGNKTKFAGWWDKIPQGIKDVVKNTAPHGETIHNTIDAFFKNDTKLIQLKQAVDKLLEQCNIKLYIFLDDLDRLAPDEIIQIFQLIKLNANFKNTFFVVAYDKEVVLMSLRKQYGDMAEKYLSKIIQIDYTLPELTRHQLDKFFDKKFSELLQSCQIEYKSADFNLIWEQQGLRHYFTTLRDIYRYINGLRFRLPSIKKEVDIEHFLILEAIRVFDSDAYQKIYDLCHESITMAGVVTPLRQDNNASISDDFSSEFRSITPFTRPDEAKTYFKPNTLRLIEYLFPKYVSPTYESTSRKIYNRLCFETYFTLTVTHQNVAEQELSDFLTNSMRREGVLNQIIMTDRLDIFFEWLRDPKLLKRYTIDDPNIFWVLLNNRQFAVEDEYIEIYHSQLIEALLCIVDQFQVKSLKSKQGIDFLLDELVFLNSCRMNAAKICTLNYLHWQLEDKSFRYYQQVRQNETKIVAGLKKHLDDARLWDHSFQHRRFVESRGIGCFSRIASEIYLEKLDKILQNPSECTHRLTLVLEVMCMRSYKGSYAKWQERRGEWSGINPVMKPFLLPNAEYEKQFLAALEKLDKSLLTENERTLLSNFTSYN